MSSPRGPKRSRIDTTRELPSKGNVELQRFRLVVAKAPNPRALPSMSSDSAEVCIGTSAQNQLVLTDPAVSRHHAAITITPKGFLIRDLDSTNGTYLGGHQIIAAYLKHGATIGVGETTIRFEALEDKLVEPVSEDIRFGRILGRSVEMRRIFAALEKIAASEATLLIEGETGTGKGLLARVVHEKSARANGPFVVLDCGSLPPTLIESELFGSMKGAFTGAVEAKAGAFEAAQGGTIFLDEIGELPIALQPKLLRALEERVVRRLGGTQDVQLDVRIIAATNRDLRQAVNRGAFRSDLYYRLDVVRVTVPPLRERRDDVPMLVAHFFQQLSEGGDQTPSAELVEALKEHQWPGNVRELRSAVERTLLTGDPAIASMPANAPSVVSSDAALDDPALYETSESFRAAKGKAIARWERAFIEALVRENQGNLSRASRAAQMDRAHLRDLLRRYGLSRGIE